jgi:Domain of unknown function (DU1801)
MAELKTKLNDSSVEGFLNTVKDEQKRSDSFELLKIMQEISGEPPKMWGTAIIGFGSYHYVYASGREGDWMLAGFSPRKSSISLYLMAGFDRLGDELAQLGKHKVGKGCLYVKRLSDIDEKVLKKMVKKSISIMKKRYN